MDQTAKSISEKQQNKNPQIFWRIYYFFCIFLGKYMETSLWIKSSKAGEFRFSKKIKSLVKSSRFAFSIATICQFCENIMKSPLNIAGINKD